MTKTNQETADAIKKIGDYEDFDDFIKQTGFTIEQAYNYLVDLYEQEILFKGN